MPVNEPSRLIKALSLSYLIINSFKFYFNFSETITSDTENMTVLLIQKNIKGFARHKL